MIRLIVATAVGFLTLSTACQARTWYGIDFNTQTCATDIETVSSPEQALMKLREMGIVPRVTVKRDANGEIIAVELAATINGNPVVSYWFSSKALCEQMVNAAIQNGDLPTTSELK